MPVLHAQAPEWDFSPVFIFSGACGGQNCCEPSRKLDAIWRVYCCLLIRACMRRAQSRATWMARSCCSCVCCVEGCDWRASSMDPLIQLPPPSLTIKFPCRARVIKPPSVRYITLSFSVSEARWLPRRQVRETCTSSWSTPSCSSTTTVSRTTSRWPWPPPAASHVPHAWPLLACPLVRIALEVHSC